MIDVGRSENVEGVAAGSGMAASGSGQRANARPAGMISLSAAVRDRLRCPVCSAALRGSPEAMVCDACATVFPVVCNVPVLINDNRSVLDRKSTRLNSSHMSISYAVFCLKKKKNIQDAAAHQLSQRDHVP